MLFLRGFVPLLAVLSAASACSRDSGAAAGGPPSQPALSAAVTAAPGSNPDSFSPARGGVPQEPAAVDEPAPAGMVRVPGGRFLMGCADGYNNVVDDKCAPSELPARLVDVDSFFIDIDEVTVGQYTGCVEAGACQAPYNGGECNFGEKDRLKYPINCVTWDDARLFCKWAGKRLPYEAEWEKAARGTDGRRYPWGNQEPDEGGLWRANLGEGLTKLLWMRDQWEYDAPVGFFSAYSSPYGCNDMAGNVAEWVHDWWAESYAGMTDVNPRGPDAGNQHVVRGGSFREYRQRIRTSARGYHYTDFMDGNVGFRCAADVGRR
ncbi:MAG TPA: SUMF1/EgtB/PvdO family nonheme iron enzyme [Myxococcota bacterium]|nr:SUMF1/EgtB/PvdO family nonheme iron enzyme [Myxococcota bacterium]